MSQQASDESGEAIRPSGSGDEPRPQWRAAGKVPPARPSPAWPAHIPLAGAYMLIRFSSQTQLNACMHCLPKRTVIK